MSTQDSDAESSISSQTRYTPTYLPTYKPSIYFNDHNLTHHDNPIEQKPPNTPFPSRIPLPNPPPACASPRASSSKSNNSQ